MLNRFRTEQIHCAANLHTWRQTNALYMRTTTDDKPYRINLSLQL